MVWYDILTWYGHKKPKFGNIVKNNWIIRWVALVAKQVKIVHHLLSNILPHVLPVMDQNNLHRYTSRIQPANLDLGKTLISDTSRFNARRLHNQHLYCIFLTAARTAVTENRWVSWFNNVAWFWWNDFLWCCWIKSWVTQCSLGNNYRTALVIGQVLCVL